MKCRECGMPALDGEPLCWNHSPTVAPERARARQRGGRRNRSRYGTLPPDAPVPLRTAEQIQAEVERVFHDTLVQPNSALRSRALAAVLGLAVRVLETTELEQRIAALETRAQMRAA